MCERGFDIDAIPITKALGNLLTTATNKVIAFVEGHPELSRGPGDDPDGWAENMATLGQLCDDVSEVNYHANVVVGALSGDLV